MRRPRQTLAAALLLPLLAGCGGAPQASDPPAAPTATPSDRTTTQQQPSVPDLPAAADGPNKRAAARFVTYYAELLNYASASGDTAPARAVSAAECDSCNSVTDLIDRVYAAGGNATGGDWTVKPLTAQRSSDGWSINAQVDLAPQTLTESDGAEPQRFEGGRTQASFLVRYVAGGWQMQQWTRAS